MGRNLGYMIVKIDKSLLNQVGVLIAEQIVKIGFAKTNSEARRLIQQKAVSINEDLVSDPAARLFWKPETGFIIIERIMES
jgi:tyrosyl-tRNA synthetase